MPLTPTAGHLLRTFGSGQNHHRAAPIGAPGAQPGIQRQRYHRQPRGTEQDGWTIILTVEAFKMSIDAGALLEWEEVYPGKFYGTLHTELERLWAEGKTVVFDVDVVGGANLRRMLGDSALAIFIQPPSLEVLRHRLESQERTPSG